MPEYSGVNFVPSPQDIIFISIESVDFPCTLLHSFKFLISSRLFHSYRANIFGFPNFPAIKTKNPGLLDQRLAVGWFRDSIAASRGDPARMVLVGHSAGSMSIVYWSYAYKDEPTVSEFVGLSGQPGLCRLTKEHHGPVLPIQQGAAMLIKSLNSIV